MKVLVGGGTGFVGRYLAYQLKQKGHQVINISRTLDPEKEKTCITWDELLHNGLPEDTGAVVNLAGKLLMDPTERWTEEVKREVRLSRVDTTKMLRNMIKDAEKPPKVWVSSSAVGYYPPSDTKEYTEDSVEGKGDFLSQLCREWERVAQLPENSPTRHATVRIGLVLGRDGGMIQNLYVPFFLGVGGRIGSGTQWFPWIHARDCAGIIVHAIENDNVSGVMNAVAPAADTNSDFTKAFASAMWRPALFPVPEFALNLVFGAERAGPMVKGPKVVPKRTLESGYEYRYPDLASACKEFSRFSAFNEENNPLIFK